MVNPWDQLFVDWLTAEDEKREDLYVITLAQTALQLAQLAFYWLKADEKIDNRDAAIDKQISFMERSEQYNDTDSYPMLLLKVQTLDIPVRSPDLCEDALFCKAESLADGHAVNNSSEYFAKRSCRGIPSNWNIKVGSHHASKAQAYASGLVANNAKRLEENMRTKKIQLLRAAQSSSKALYTANDVLSRYSQETSIYAGLADLYVQGFNSAGAGLGVAMGQLGQRGTNNTGSTSGGNGGSVSGSSGLSNSGVPSWYATGTTGGQTL